MLTHFLNKLTFILGSWCQFDCDLKNP